MDPRLTTTALYWLALSAALCGVAYMPYALARMFVLGIARTAGNPRPEFATQLPLWAQRARMAHANLVENLVVMTALVAVAALQGMAAQPSVVHAAELFFICRVAHYVVYAAGVPWLRTVAFLGTFAAEAWLFILVIGGKSGAGGVHP